MQKLTIFVQSHVSAHTTAQVLFCTICFLLLWEGVVLYFKIPGATISEVSWAYLNKYLLLAIVFGVLLGHIVWQYQSAWKRKQNADGTFSLVPIEPDDDKINNEINDETKNFHDLPKTIG